MNSGEGWKASSRVFPPTGPAIGDDTDSNFVLQHEIPQLSRHRSANNNDINTEDPYLSIPITHPTSCKAPTCVLDTSLPQIVEFGSYSTLRLWFSIFGKIFAAIMRLLVLVLALVLLPLLRILPASVREIAVNGVFSLGYRVYLTEMFGGWIHTQMVNSTHPSGQCHDTHTTTIFPTHYSTFSVWPIPILADNYAYVVIDKATNTAAVVDPAAPSVVVDVVARLGIRLHFILCTHGHHDHAGGNCEMKRRFPNASVVAGSSRTVPAVSHVAQNGEVLWLGKTPIVVLSTPCHTRDHVMFAFGSKITADENGLNSLSTAQAIFTGDTLFIGGVGALFHGNSNDMLNSLGALAPLPDSCAVFCGHEYAEHLLWFAAWLEPTNHQILRRAHWASIQRSFQQPTVPSTIGWERRTNPWMRHGDVALVTAVEMRLSAYRSIPWWKRQWGNAIPKSWLQPLRTHDFSRRGNVYELDEQEFSQKQGAACLDSLTSLVKMFRGSVAMSCMMNAPTMQPNGASHRNIQSLVITTKHMYFVGSPPDLEI